MEFNKVEKRFFSTVLNAELDVPVKAILRCDKKEFEVIVVPYLSKSGEFFLKYSCYAVGASRRTGSNWHKASKACCRAERYKWVLSA